MTINIKQFSEDQIIDVHNGQHKFSDKPINWHYMAGLIQTDGSFSFSWTNRDKCLRPKIFITFGQKRFYFAVQRIVSFLRSEGISARPDPNSLEACTRKGPTKGLNVVIEGQENAKKLIVKLKEAFSFCDGVFLADEKLKDFLIFEKVIELRDKEKTTTDRNLKKNYNLISVGLKMKASERALHGNAKPAIHWLNMFNLDANSDFETVSNPIYQEAINTSTEKTISLLNYIESLNGNRDHQPLRNFFTGIMEGDGSYGYSFFTHLDENNQRVAGRRGLELVAIASLTNLNETDEFPGQYYYKIVNAWFKTNRPSQGVEPGTNSNRLQWKSLKDVKLVINSIESLYILRSEFRRQHTEVVVDKLSSGDAYNDKNFLKELVNLRASKKFADDQHISHFDKNYYLGLIEQFYP